jgi:hypothetical protein
MKGIWKDTNKNFLKDKLEWYVKNNNFTFERNYKKNWHQDSSISERVLNTEFTEYQQFIMEVKVPIMQHKEYKTFKFLCYFKPYVNVHFNRDNWSPCDFIFSDENEFFINKGYEHSETDNKLINLEDITYKDSYGELQGVSNFFYWRNWDDWANEIEYVSVEPTMEFDSEMIIHYFEHSSWRPPYELYKTFIDYYKEGGFVESIKIDEYQINYLDKPTKDDGYEQVDLRVGHRPKSSKDLYSDKDLREFKQKLVQEDGREWADEFECTISRDKNLELSLSNWEDYSDTSFLCGGDVDWEYKDFIEEYKVKYYNYRLDDPYSTMIEINS